MFFLSSTWKKMTICVVFAQWSHGLYVMTVCKDILVWQMMGYFWHDKVLPLLAWQTVESYWYHRLWVLLTWYSVVPFGMIDYNAGLKWECKAVLNMFLLYMPCPFLSKHQSAPMSNINNLSFIVPSGVNGPILHKHTCDMEHMHHLCD